MEQPASTPAEDGHDRAFAAIIATVERLDELGLSAEDGRALIEPASAFHWS